MTTIVTRAGKGSPLTNTEVDANFTNLNSAKYELGNSPAFATQLIGPATAANFTRFPNALAVVSNTASGIQQNETAVNIGVVGEATGNSSTNAHGIGVYGAAYTNGAAGADAITGEGHVSATGDTGSAVGVRGYATQAHTGGRNIGLFGEASSGLTNYALWMHTGDIYSNAAQTWYLNGNLTFSGAYTTTIPTLNLTNALGAAYGGTGASTLTANSVLLGNGTSALQTVAPGTSGNVLTSNGTSWTSSAPTGATVTPTVANSTYYVIGTTAVSGSLSAASISNTNVVSYNASTGALSAVSHVSSSDERLKTNWVGLDLDFVARLQDVKHGTFERISSGNREVGVTAQSLQKLIPEAVIEGEDGLLAVNYGGAALVAAIELAKVVQELRAEIAELKAKLG